MIIYNGGRCSGKTTKAIKYVKCHPGTVLFVKNEDIAKDIRKEHGIMVESHVVLRDKFSTYIHEDNPIFIDDFNDLYTSKLMGINTLAKVEQLKTKFTSAASLRAMINSRGVEQFNKDFPEWSIE